MYLGIDIGTSAVKAVLIDGEGRLRGERSAPLSVSRPAPLMSEQDPDDWWKATETAVLSLPETDRRAVRAIGLAGQMHGATLLDESDRPLRPAILWNDGRSGAECRLLEEAEPDTRRITGNAAMAGFTAPKLLWVREQEPDLFRRTRTVLLPKDYVRLQMTGEKATDVSDASGTLWLDVEARAWSPAMLAASGLGVDAMPRLHEGSEPTGTLRHAVAARWGMGEVPVAAGGGDNAAAAVGLGVVDPGDCFLSLGTSGVCFVATDRLRAAPDNGLHAFCHALPGRWHQMSVMLSAAACLDWAAALLGLGDVPALLAAAEQARSDRSRPIFLPYLSGERTPHADPHAQGVFFGMTATTGAPELALSVLEGVAMGLRDGLDTIVAAGSSPETITMAGGGSRSSFWGAIIAAALDRPLVFREAGAVGPAFGAARLARLCVEGHADAAIQPPAVTGVEEPDPGRAAHFAERQQRFRALYSAVQPHFRGQQ